MAEYWKSTPKYWCKFCATYVRDTTLEKKQHDATPRHQNNIQKSLRELHKTRERDERDKQRAKDEVTRLNGIIGSASAASGSSAPGSKLKQSAPAPLPATKTATVEQRRRQMEQLAAMGIAVPEEHRLDKPTTSGWTTVSERLVYNKVEENIKEEDDEKKEALGSHGVRKRKLDDDEDEDEPTTVKSKGNWGSTLKTYPGSKAQQDEDLDALLAGATARRPPETTIKSEEPSVSTEMPTLKSSESVDEARPLSDIPDINEPAAAVKQEDAAAAEPAVVFKKRKAKR